MGFRDKWYPAMVTALRGLRGDSATGIDGQIMPLLQASDGIPVLGSISPSIVNALHNFHRRINRDDHATQVMRSEALDDGIFYIIPSAVAQIGWIEARDYVAGIGRPGAAYKRSLAVNGDTYEPYIVHNPITGDETQLLSFLRQMMADWQRAVDAAAIMLATKPTASSTAEPLQVGVFLAAMRSLCADLDVLSENPPVIASDKIKGALLDSLHKTEEWAGQAAADIAGEVGKAAGLVAKGFFSEAGLTSLMVAGIAVWLFVK